MKSTLNTIGFAALLCGIATMPAFAQTMGAGPTGAISGPTEDTSNGRINNTAVPDAAPQGSNVATTSSNAAADATNTEATARAQSDRQKAKDTAGASNR